jgi:hypothetical protein
MESGTSRQINTRCVRLHKLPWQLATRNGFHLKVKQEMLHDSARQFIASELRRRRIIAAERVDACCALSAWDSNWLESLKL